MSYEKKTYKYLEMDGEKMNEREKENNATIRGGKTFKVSSNFITYIFENNFIKKLLMYM